MPPVRNTLSGGVASSAATSSQQMGQPAQEIHAGGGEVFATGRDRQRRIDVVQFVAAGFVFAEPNLHRLHAAVQARGAAILLQRLQAVVVRRRHFAEIAFVEGTLARHVLDHRRVDEMMRGHARVAAAEQRHEVGHAQGQVHVGAAIGQAPGAMDHRHLAAADLRMGDVGGAAADIHHQGRVPDLAAQVVVQRGGHGFFKEIHSFEAGDLRRFGQDVQRLFAAFGSQRTAELHRPPDRGQAYVDVQLFARRHPDVFQDLRGDAGDGLARARQQVVAEHRLRRLHQVAAAFLKITVDGFLAEHRIVQVGGGFFRFLDLGLQPLPAHHLHRIAVQLRLAARGHAAAGLFGLGRTHQHGDFALAFAGHVEISGIGQVGGEEDRGAELRQPVELDMLQPVAHARGRRRIAGAEVDADSHGRGEACAGPAILRGAGGKSCIATRGEERHEGDPWRPGRGFNPIWRWKLGIGQEIDQRADRGQESSPRGEDGVDDLAAVAPIAAARAPVRRGDRSRTIIIAAAARRPCRPTRHRAGSTCRG